MRFFASLCDKKNLIVYKDIMQIFTELNKNPNLSLALGYFDGVHLGHQAVIKGAVEYAHKNSKKSAVITFKDHPCCYLWGVCPKYILTRENRRKHIENLGVDYLYEIDFESICNLNADEYLQNIIIKHFTPSAIFTGWNHTFGHNKRGNAEYLHQHATNYEYYEIEPKSFNNEIISSTTIRELLTKGKIEHANSMLGYKFSITGTVIEGNKIGRTIGFKTANIKYPSELIDLPFGVYDVFANNKNAIANFGVRPTVDGHQAVLEVHILNFEEDIYGQEITIEFNRMLRPEKKFQSLEELKKQIKSDIKSITVR